MAVLSKQPNPKSPVSILQVIEEEADWEDGEIRPSPPLEDGEILPSPLCGDGIDDGERAAEVVAVVSKKLGAEEVVAEKKRLDDDCLGSKKPLSMMAEERTTTNTLTVVAPHGEPKPTTSLSLSPAQSRLAALRRSLSDIDDGSQLADLAKAITDVDRRINCAGVIVKSNFKGDPRLLPKAKIDYLKRMTRQKIHLETQHQELIRQRTNLMRQISRLEVEMVTNTAHFSDAWDITRDLHRIGLSSYFVPADTTRLRGIGLVLKPEYL